jgi:hypothetical protein
MRVWLGIEGQGGCCIIGNIGRAYKLWDLRSIPDAMVEPEVSAIQQWLALKCVVRLWCQFKVNTDNRRMWEFGIYNMSKRKSVVPLGRGSSIIPIVVANTKELPRPLMAQGGIECKSRKSDHTGEMWQVAPVSRINGVADGEAEEVLLLVVYAA